MKRNEMLRSARPPPNRKSGLKAGSIIAFEDTSGS